MANFRFIDGKNVSDDIEKFDDFDIELGLNSTTKTFTKSLSKTLGATRDTFEYLERFYFKDCASHAAILGTVFKTDICGGITIPMKITVEGAKTFPVQRKIEFTMKSATLDDQAYDKLSTDCIFDNGLLEKYEIPLVYYCQQPAYIQWAVVHGRSKSTKNHSKTCLRDSHAQALWLQSQNIKICFRKTR